LLQKQTSAKVQDETLGLFKCRTYVLTIAKYQQDAPPDPRMAIFVSESMLLGLNEGIRNGVMPRSLDEEERVGVDSTHARGKSNVGIEETRTRRVR